MVLKAMKRVLAIAIASVIVLQIQAQSVFQSSLPARPPKKGNLYGTVECAGKPLAGVPVSDGVNIVLTDRKGYYALESDKRNGYVFITIPSCYEAPVDYPNPVPAFWAATDNDPTSVERHDFTLESVDNMRHTIVAVTDIHMCNMKFDVEQFTTIAMPRITAEVDKYRNAGTRVYTMCAGDSSYDIFWYDFMYDICSFRTMLGKKGYPTPFFNTMGNHDHDGATSSGDRTDFDSAAKFRRSFGPTFYSVNIGAIHYVFLDNIIYLNTPTKKPVGKNIAGKRDYIQNVTGEQMEWLRKDLALVKDKSTPIVVVMHCPVYDYLNNTTFNALRSDFNRIVDGKKVKSMQAAEEFSAAFREFQTVHFITGHSHRNKTTYCADDASHPELRNIVDHNIGALSGNWWDTYTVSGVSLGWDTAPSGFEVFPVDGKKIEWYWTSLDCGAEKQFRCFDGNSVRDYYRNDDEIKVLLAHYPDTRRDFASMDDNQILIHVWAWNPKWTVRAYENGKELAVRHQPTENPQYNIAYVIPKTNWRRNWIQKYAKSTVRNMFVTEASSADSAIDVVVTDEFGNEYRETMIRPKPFTRDMK